MRAVLSKAPGGPETLVVEEGLDPRPQKGEVVIEVKAIGVNFPDTLIIEDKYQFKPQRPFVGAPIPASELEKWEGNPRGFLAWLRQHTLDLGM